MTKEQVQLVRYASHYWLDLEIERFYKRVIRGINPQLEVPIEEWLKLLKTFHNKVEYRGVFVTGKLLL